MPNDYKMGQTLPASAQLGRRDAFHVPGILAKSAVPLYGSMLVRFTDDALTTVTPVGCDGHGIVDPFLPQGAKPGELFWVLPLPGTTSNLTHKFDVILPQPAELIAEEDSSDDDDGCVGCYEASNDTAELKVDDSCKGCY